VPKIVARQVYASLAPTVTFDDEGIALAPLWAKPVCIGWSEVKCVSVTPWMERGPEGWREAPSPFRHGPSIFETKRLFALDVVVRDRRPIRARTGSWLKRLWLDTWLQAMYGLDDRPEPDRSVFELTLRRDLIEGTVDELLDLVQARSRFELVVHLD
jgi:hypothetical protein